jgi:hypothetical protein
VFNNRLGTSALLKEVKVDAFDSVMSKPLVKNKNQVFSQTFFVPPSKYVNATLLAGA